MEKLAKYIVIFGLIFLIINIIGYIFHITLFISVLSNPTGGGGISYCNIPFIISILITIIIYIIDIRNKIL